MVQTVFIDRDTILEAEEQNSALVRMTRSCLVYGVNRGDYRALTDALNDPDLPRADGSRASLPEVGGAPNLILTKKVAKLVPGDTIAFEVTLYYEAIGRSGQNLNFPPTGVVLGKVSATISQTETNKDVDGNEITVQHTYPTTDKQMRPNPTQVQGGVVQVYQGEIDLRYEGIMAIAFPWFVSRGIRGAVNDNFWSGGAPREWMCTSCEYEPFDVHSNLYSFCFQFQHREGGWDPGCSFIDERTKKPPEGLVEGVGFKTVLEYRQVNFELMMGVRVQGG